MPEPPFYVTFKKCAFIILNAIHEFVMTLTLLGRLRKHKKEQKGRRHCNTERKIIEWNRNKITLREIIKQVKENEIELNKLREEPAEAQLPPTLKRTCMLTDARPRGFI